MDKKTTCVAVSTDTHQKVKSHLKKEKDGKDIGKFFDAAAIEKLQKEKSKK